MGLLPTAQRSAFWRPDTYSSTLCPRCRLADETSDHIFACPENALTQAGFAARIREEMVSALPAALAPDGRSLANVLVASGLSLSSFRGTLSASLSALLRSVPSSLSQTTAGTALLHALYNVAYFDIWKPRCEATNALELRRGLTARQKRLPPNQCPQADSHIDPARVPTVLHGQPHTSSPSFASSQADVMAIWSRAINKFVGNP